MPGVITAGRLVDDRYRLLEALEEGGMGILWKAEDLTSERQVMVKELRFPDPLDHMQRRALAARVRREARAMAAVSHPGLAHIVDVVDDGDRPWVVTELIDAPTLAQRIAADGPMDPEFVALLGIRLLDVLDAAGDQDMVHRFLQPSKVFVSPFGEVRLADFGIASLIGDPAVASSGAVGAVSFMAPEQAGTPEADIWSLGAVLYFAVEGVAPFDGDDSAAVLAAVADQAPRPAANAGPLARVLELALQKDPSERPAADELRALLEVAAGPLAPQPEAEEPEAEHAEVDSEAEGGPAEITDAGGATIVGDEPGFDAEGDIDVESEANAAADVAADTEAADAPAIEEAPLAPLPPRVALERMFSPDPGAPPAVFTPKEEHRVPPAPWPVEHRRGLLTTVLCAAVMAIMIAILLTNGRDIFTSRSRAARTIAAITWAQYSDPATGFTVDYPADWLVSRDGIYTDFRHPQAAAALRIVAQDSTATSAVVGWTDLETRLASEQPTYRRIRLEPKEFRALDAAEWEFTYSKNNVQLHNIDLGVITGTRSFALNFETRSTNWDAIKPLFQRFESSFKPPPP